MSDKTCPNCNNKIDENYKFCPECGCSFENRNENHDQEKKQDFFTFTEDIASKIQNKLGNEDLFNTNEIKEIIGNLDEDSINKLLDKYGISPSRIKLLTLNKLFEKVDMTKLKEDLIEFGIISPESDVETVKAEVVVEEKDVEEKSQEDDVLLIEIKKGSEKSNNDGIDEKDESQDDEKTVNHGDVKTDENSSDNQYVCMKCGFENRPNVKFCTKCGNKLI